jgi:hypothetical protein
VHPARQGLGALKKMRETPAAGNRYLEALPFPEMLECCRVQIESEAEGGASQRDRDAVIRHHEACKPALWACALLPEFG